MKICDIEAILEASVKNGWPLEVTHFQFAPPGTTAIFTGFRIGSAQFLFTNGYWQFGEFPKEDFMLLPAQPPVEVMLSKVDGGWFRLGDLLLIRKDQVKLVPKKEDITADALAAMASGAKKPEDRLLAGIPEAPPTEGFLLKKLMRTIDVLEHETGVYISLPSLLLMLKTQDVGLYNVIMERGTEHADVRERLTDAFLRGLDFNNLPRTLTTDKARKEFWAAVHRKALSLGHDVRYP